MEVPGCEPQGRLPWVAVPQEAGVNQTVIQTVIKSDNGPPQTLWAPRGPQNWKHWEKAEPLGELGC